MAANHLPPPNSARLAITSLCTVLRHYGVSTVDPEVIRQAKFDGPVVGPMWRILHDTVLVVLAGCPSTAAAHEAMSRLWDQLQLELADDLGPDDFPQEGAALVLRQLAIWGAPLELLHALGPSAGATPAGPGREGAGDTGASWQGGLREAPARAPGAPAVRSRPLLLALGWLVAAAGLFERRISELEPGPQLQELLPPYPQDSCASSAVQTAYDTAAQDARELVRRLPAGNTAAAPRGPGAGARLPSGDPFGPSPAALAAEAVWADVEAAAQRAVMLCGRVRSRMVALQAAMDCRHKLSHSLWSRQSAASPSSRPLTAYELQLCAQPAVVQRHMAALEAATLALLEQQELAAHGALFFEWMGSVLQEEQQHRWHQQQQQQQQRDRPPEGRERSKPSAAGGPLASLEHLPPAGSEAGSRLMAHLMAQLEAAKQAAAPELSAARQRLAAGPQVEGSRGAAAASGAPPRSGLRPAQPPALTLQHFLSLADQAVPEQYTADTPQDSASSPIDQLDGGQQPPRLSLPGALLGVDGPTGTGSAAGANASTPWRLPGDVAAALTAVQEAQCRQRSTAEVESERFRQMRYASLLRYDFSGPQVGFGGAGPGGGGGGPLASVLAAAAVAGGSATGGPGVAVGEETQRLLAAVLTAARPLAKTRASNKAALLAAVQDLPEGYLVAGI